MKALWHDSAVTDSAAGTRPGPRTRIRPQQIVRAAVDCIVEQGFYRASSNEIARRAGVSWGSIQYYFGSRERLMLAVVEDLNRGFTAEVGRIRIEGATVGERLAALYDALDRQYNTPVYLARMQILLNLQNDPGTSAEVAQILDDQARETAAEIYRLLDEVLGAGASRARGTALFHAIRGFIISLQISESVSHDPRLQTEPALRAEFLDMLRGGAGPDAEPGSTREASPER